jgi:hypothetical protein
MEGYYPMSSSLIVTKELVGDHWLVTAELSQDSTLPIDIFAYTNTGTSSLGEFFGTCWLKDLTNLSIFDGTPLPTFGNKYVRYRQAKIKVLLEDDVDSVINALVHNVEQLSLAYASKTNTTEVFPIP